jgi:dTDP-D-glucose 4,6-dehydratase
MTHKILVTGGAGFIGTNLVVWGATLKLPSVLW